MHSWEYFLNKDLLPLWNWKIIYKKRKWNRLVFSRTVLEEIEAPKIRTTFRGEGLLVIEWYKSFVVIQKFKKTRDKNTFFCWICNNYSNGNLHVAQHVQKVKTLRKNYLGWHAASKANNADFKLEQSKNILRLSHYWKLRLKP